MVLDDANGQLGLADPQVGLLPCKRVVNLSGDYGLDCHLLVLVGRVQLIADMVPAHNVVQVVDLGRVGNVAQDDHLSFWVVDVRNAIEDQLDVDEVFHIHVEANWAAERLLAVVERFELH